MKEKQNVRDFHKDLREQQAFLTASCEGFDRGMEVDAKRLAVTLRVLFHDTTLSKSLLGQMGIKDKLMWLSSGEVDPRNVMSTHALVIMRFGADSQGNECVRFLPRDQATVLAFGRLQEFESWWNVPVIKDENGNEFSRRNLVLALANDDGGAHVGTLNAKGRRLAHEGGLGWVLGGEQVTDPEKLTLNPMFPSVRTIADEVILSLHNQQDILMAAEPGP